MNLTSPFSLSIIAIVALSLLGRIGDKGLKAAAETIRAKVASVLPHSSKQPIDDVSLSYRRMLVTVGVRRQRLELVG